MSRYITLKQLQRNGACRDYVNTFKALFPTGKVKVNSLTVNALAQWASFYFLKTRLLSPKQKKVYARSAYNTSQKMALLRALVPGFADLRVDAQNTLSHAFRSHLNKEWRIQMAEAFNVAYNSPRYNEA